MKPPVITVPTGAYLGPVNTQLSGSHSKGSLFGGVSVSQVGTRVPGGPVVHAHSVNGIMVQSAKTSK